MTELLSPELQRARRVGRSELRIGGVVFGVAILFWLAWFTDNSGHGERAFLLLPVVFLGPFGIGAILSGVALRYRWPGSRWFSVAPFAFTAVALAAVWVRYF